MIIGRVVGHVWATRKNDDLCGYKLLVVEKMEQTNIFKNIVVAADTIGAGEGDLVLLVQSSSARHAMADPSVPIDMSVVGIIDGLEINGEKLES